MNEKDIRKKIEKFKYPYLKIAYLEKVLSRKEIPKRETKFAGIRVLADLYSQDQQHLNAAWHYKRIGEKEKAINELRKAVRKGSKDFPITKVYEKAAAEFKKYGLEEESEKAYLLSKE